MSLEYYIILTRQQSAGYQLVLHELFVSLTFRERFGLVSSLLAGVSSHPYVLWILTK